MNCKPHLCDICKNEKYHGAVCITKGHQGMRWICFECQDILIRQDAEAAKARDNNGQPGNV